MKATAIACALLLAAALAPADDSTDLAGEWEVQILLEVDIDRKYLQCAANVPYTFRHGKETVSSDGHCCSCIQSRI
jgi:hypothetical protein